MLMVHAYLSVATKFGSYSEVGSDACVVSKTLRPLYSPQEGQILWGTIGAEQFGQGTRVGAVILS